MKSLLIRLGLEASPSLNIHGWKLHLRSFLPRVAFCNKNYFIRKLVDGAKPEKSTTPVSCPKHAVLLAGPVCSPFADVWNTHVPLSKVERERLLATQAVNSNANYPHHCLLLSSSLHISNE